jgi:tetratricopeptide (TPR) repeat protein
MWHSIKMVRLSVWIALLAMGSIGAGTAHAQTTRAAKAANTPSAALARAEAAFERGDLLAAERAYGDVLQTDPDQPRALFRLAQIRRRRDPALAVSLLQQYVKQVPADPWGYQALAAAQADMGRGDEAVTTYDRALRLEPEDRDIALGEPRLLARLGRSDTAVVAYQHWLTSHPNDGEAWRELAEQLQREKRWRSAASALQHAVTLTPRDSKLAARLAAAKLRTAPAVELGLLGIGETDVATLGGAISGDFLAGDRSRIGVSFQQRRIESFDTIASTRRLAVRASVAARQDVQLAFSGGAVWSDRQDIEDTSSTHPELTFRLRRHPVARGVTVDVRAVHGPVDVTPQLVTDGLIRSQGTLTVEAPLGDGPLSLRGLGRMAVLSRLGDHNRTARLGAGLAVAIAPDAHLSGQWQRARYDHAATGYFTPQRADTIDGGLDLDREFEAVALALDVGAGGQRVQKFDQPLGTWSPSFRLWAMMAWTVHPGRQLLIECESYDSHVADAVSATADRWRYTSVTASLRFVLH